MTRRHADPVQVVRRDEEPHQFVWRGRVYLVRSVLDRWVETRPWWRSAAVRGLTAAGSVADLDQLDAQLDDGEQEVWRVEAGAGRCGPAGVFDLGMRSATAEWTLQRVAD